MVPFYVSSCKCMFTWHLSRASFQRQKHESAMMIDEDALSCSCIPTAVDSIQSYRMKVSLVIDLGAARERERRKDPLFVSTRGFV